MPSPQDHPEQSFRVAYYRSVQDTLFEHLRDREVVGFGREVVAGSSADPARAEPGRTALHIHDLEDLGDAVRSGVVGFLLPGLGGPGVLGLRISAGDGAGIDTVATVALNLAESLERGGLDTTAMTDGAGGLYLFGFAVDEESIRRRHDPTSDRTTAALRLAADLALRAPEIATTNRSDADGRVLIEALSADRAAPAPYSLTAAAEPSGVVVPLTLDEVAAASAGMPLDIESGQVPRRIGDYGDLAAGLSGARARPA